MFNKLNKAIFALFITLTLSFAGMAQGLKVEKISKAEAPGKNIEFPKDLNGNSCALVEVPLKNTSVTFEGNVVGTPTYQDGIYHVFLTRNSKYLNIKYPSAEPLLVRFNDFDIKSLPSMSVIRIDLYEPSSNLTEKLDANVPEVSEEAERLYREGGSLMSANNYVDAFPYFLHAYELGHPKAAYQLGFIYSDPYHSARKLPLAKKYAAIPDTPVKRDMKKAFEYYKESAEAGYVMAQFAVGECLEKGNGVAKNKEEAMLWYEKAAEQGHLQAKDKLGDKVKKNRTFGFVTSYGTSGNEFILNEITSDANDLSAINNGRKDKNGQFCALVKVLLPFDSVTFAGNTVGDPQFKTNEYWVYLPQGTKELEVNYPDFKPLKINFKSLGVNELVSKTTYRVSVSFPIDLINDDVDLSADDLYRIGEGFQERRDNQFIRWMEKAADKGHPRAKFQVGIQYLYGNIATKKDVKKGEKLLTEAYEDGIAEAAWTLGQYYDLLTNKTKTAQSWYDKAAAAGYEPAKGKKAKGKLKKMLLPF